LPAAWAAGDLDTSGGRAVAVSLASGIGMEALHRALVEGLQGAETPRDCPAVTNLRHVGLLERALGALERAGAGLRRSGGTLPEEFVLADLGEAKVALEEITGQRSPEDLLRHIFSRFCVGK
jgi:tRNA modification GTPase